MKTTSILTRPAVVLLCSVMMGALAACGEPIDVSAPAEMADSPGFRKKVFYLEAPCQVNVEGVGMVDIDDYIAGVVSCENGGAPLEALKAQAVQARSFLYYKLFVAGQTVIRNSQADQVYSCSYRPNGPGADHRAAAEATKGQYLAWENSIVASFYVAGAIPPNPDADSPFSSCRGNGGSDPTSTQKWVTYNRGKSGCDIDLTPLGFVPDDCRGNPHNRGCASQNGQACLARLGVDYVKQMRMFYGADIEVVVGEGRCGGPPQAATCIEKGDGSHCVDASTLVQCSGPTFVSTETCALGCSEGACIEAETPMTFCTDQADGTYCDAGSRVVCTGGELSETEVCPYGCAEGACQADTAMNNDTGTNNGGGTNNDVGTNNGSGGGGGPDDDGGSEGDDHVETPGEAGALPPLLGASPGIEGGCSTGGSAPGELALLFAAPLVALRRRQKRR